MFAQLKAQADEIELLIKNKKEEKELFSSQCSKSSKQISMYEEMIQLIYQGNLDARCKWIWENGSIKGFTYTATPKDIIDIDEIKKMIAQEETNLSNFSEAGRTCKEEIRILENKLPFALIGVDIKHFGSSTDDEPTSNNFGNLFYIFEIDMNEYNHNGNMTFSSHKIKFLPKDETINEKAIEWRQIRTFDQADGTTKTKEIPIENDPKWAYIIKTFLKPKI
jgi:hypothetical protein